MRSNPARIHLLSLFLLIFAGNAAFAADVYRVRGKLAYAGISIHDASGCVQTSVYISAAEQVSHSRGTEWSSGIVVWLSAYDQCNEGRTVASGYGDLSLDPGMLEFKGNAGATAAVEVAVFDSISGTYRTVEIDLTWTATKDERWSGRSRDVWQAAGYRYTAEFTGSNRSADAIGAVLLDGIAISSGSMDFAFLQYTREGSIEIDRQE